MAPERAEMADAAQSVVEQTITSIRNEIREGRYAPGQRLVVADLMEAFGVSAGPVREAIRRLTGEGLVDLTPNKGAAVRRYTALELREIFEVREAIESRAAELAAEKIDRGENRPKLRVERKRMHEAMKAGGPAFIAHNQDFHRLIYEMADNRRLAELAEQLTLPIYRFDYHYLMEPSYIQEAAREHERLMDALDSGDGESAGKLMRQHIGNSASAMIAAVGKAQALIKRGRTDQFG
jgi:DNA-binding GntR family transcriptional regulator